MGGEPEFHSLAPDAQRLESLAEFAAGAGHELNNPVATIVGRVQLLLRDESDPARRQAMETIVGQAYRIRDMIADVMLFARPPVADLCETDWVELVSEAIAGVTKGRPEREGRVEWAGVGPVWILADPVQLSVVVAELLTNALEADTEGVISVSVDTGDSVVLEIRDHGPGLDERSRRHLFDPFYSGRQAGRGLGFGLPKCWRIVTLQGGRIEVESNRPTGLCVRVIWPAAV
jgi:signal transduction histidine kinase